MHYHFFCPAPKIRAKITFQKYLHSWEQPQNSFPYPVLTYHFLVPIGALDHSYSLLFRRQFYFQGLAYALKVFNYFFTAVFILEAGMKIAALGCGRYLNDRLVYLYYEYILLKNKNSSRIIQCMSSIF